MYERGQYFTVHYRFNRYGEVYDAFFTPAVSGVHYLWMSSDNGGEVLLTSGTNASLLERYDMYLQAQLHLFTVGFFLHFM